MISIAALVIMALGTFGGIASVVLEIKTHEPIYHVVMKVSAICFGIGGVLLGVTL